MSLASKNAMFVTLCASCVVLALLSTALNTALPAIAVGVGVQAQTAQWLVSGYALALAICMPATGFMASRFPTRPLYVGALALFVVCTVACALSGSFALIMAARVGQAAANALVSNLTQVSILAVFSKEQRGSRMGWFGLSVGVAPVIAPALGGFVVDMFGWRALFAVIAAMGAVCLAAALTFVRNVLPASVREFDGLSFGLSVPVFGGFAIGLGQLSSSGLSSAVAWVSLLCALAASALFFPRQMRSAEPFLNVRLLANNRFARSVLASAALYAVMMGGAAALPVYLQESLSCTAFAAGAVVLPAALLMAAVNPIAGWLFDRMGMPRLAFAGALLLLLGNVGMCVPAAGSSVVAAAVLAALRYVGIGLVQMPLVTWGNSAVPDADMPQATALLTSFRNVAGAMGVAVFVGVLGAVGMPAAFAGMAAASLLILACCKSRAR